MSTEFWSLDTSERTGGRVDAVVVVVKVLVVVLAKAVSPGISRVMVYLITESGKASVSVSSTKTCVLVKGASEGICFEATLSLHCHLPTVFAIRK